MADEKKSGDKKKRSFIYSNIVQFGVHCLCNYFFSVAIFFFFFIDFYAHRLKKIGVVQLNLLIWRIRTWGTITWLKVFYNWLYYSASNLPFCPWQTLLYTRFFGLETCTGGCGPIQAPFMMYISTYYWFLLVSHFYSYIWVWGTGQWSSWRRVDGLFLFTMG